MKDQIIHEICNRLIWEGAGIWIGAGVFIFLFLQKWRSEVGYGLWRREKMITKI
jgi:hypothetical protein